MRRYDPTILSAAGEGVKENFKFFPQKNPFFFLLFIVYITYRVFISSSFWLKEYESSEDVNIKMNLVNGNSIQLLDEKCYSSNKVSHASS